jgi:SNF2 family DNA or RNA helicase
LYRAKNSTTDKKIIILESIRLIENLNHLTKMKLKICNNNIPVLGWCDVAECGSYLQLAEDVRDGQSIIYNSDKDLDDGELCAFIFYYEYSKKTVYIVYSGKVEYLGRYPDHSAPYAYVFYPEKEIKVSSIGYCECCGEPGRVILESKKL